MNESKPSRSAFAPQYFGEHIDIRGMREIRARLGIGENEPFSHVLREIIRLQQLEKDSRPR